MPQLLDGEVLVNVALRSNRLGWAIIGSLLLVDLIWMSQTVISIVPRSLAGPVAIGGLVAGIGTYYRTYRQEPRLADALDLVGQMVAFMCVGVLFSYLVVTPGLPMRDVALDAVDRSLGLDWLGYLKWLDGYPWLARLLSFAYASFMPQILVLLIVLPFAGQGQAARTMVLAMMIAGVVTIVISGLLPALSTFAHYRVDLADYVHLKPAAAFIHMPDLLAAHAGQRLHLNLAEAHGIITFPSYHAALGLLALLGAWANRWLRWPFFAINMLMIIATPVDGGHYFADVLGGLTIATASQLAARWLLQPSDASVPAMQAETMIARPATS